MKKRLAIIILGDSNSGKTTTIKEFVNEHTGKNLKRMIVGWQKIILKFDCVFLINLNILFIPASPSERNKKIQTIIKERKKNCFPDILIVAEQPNGKNFQNTQQWLEKNNYEIVTFEIDNSNGHNVWQKFNKKNRKKKLLNRTEEIRSNIISFIKTKYLT